jgi:hypothetical protein
VEEDRIVRKARRRKKLDSVECGLVQSKIYQFSKLEQKKGEAGKQKGQFRNDKKPLNLEEGGQNQKENSEFLEVWDRIQNRKRQRSGEPELQNKLSKNI